MTKKRDNKWFGVGIAVLLLLAISVIGIYSAAPSSVLGISDVKLGSDGKPVWVFFLRPSGSGEKIDFYSPEPTDIPSYEDGNGGKYVPQYDFRVSFDPQDVVCEYDIYTNKKLLDGFREWLKFWEEDHEFYQVSESFERSAPIKVTSSKSTEVKYIDGFKIGQTVSFGDQRDGKGSIIIESQGGLIGRQDCVDTGGDLGFRLGKQSGKIDYFRIVSQTSLDRFTNERSTWSQGFSCQINSQKTKLICKRGITDIGSGTITVTADADYLDYRYFPPTQGEPRIVSIQSQAKLQQNTYGSVSVVAENIGDASGVFSIEGTGGLNIVPSVTTIQLDAGEKKAVSFSMIAPKVSSEQDIKGEFIMCSGGQFTSAKCSNKEFTVTVTSDDPDTDYCGDNICSIFETYTSCPVDCSVTPQCDGNHMQVKEGICSCEEGFVMKQDDVYGAYCAQDNTTLYVILGGIVLIILVMVAVRIGMDQGGKRK